MKKDIKEQLAYGLTIYSAITIFQYMEQEELVRNFLISEGFFKDNNLDIVALRKKYPFNPAEIKESLKENEFNILLCEHQMETGEEIQHEGEIKISKYEENILDIIIGYILRYVEERMYNEPKNNKVIYESEQNSWLTYRHYKYYLSADETYFYVQHYFNEEHYHIKKIAKETIYSLLHPNTRQILEETIAAA